MKKYKKISLLTILFLLLINTVFASWITNASNVFTDNQIGKKINEPVAYTYVGTTKTQYMTIEAALKATENSASAITVYVIPGLDRTIDNDCTIVTNVTLCIPFDDDEKGGHTDYTNRENQGGATFADATASGVTTHRKTLVTMNNEATLTNNGTIEIGGMVGTGTSQRIPTGHTYGDYAELLLTDNCTINNNGKINLYGYIKESSSNNGSQIIHNSSAEIKMPFVIYDFRGGSYTLACYNNDLMPFNNYDLPNCQPLQKFEKGAEIIGMLTIYASQWMIKDVSILGPKSQNKNYLFEMSSGYVYFKYTPYDCRYTTNDVTDKVDITNANFSYITINGKIALSSLKIELGRIILTDVNIDSAKMYCPLGFKYQIKVETGSLNISNKMKFLSGSSLTIDEKGAVNINASTSFYQGYTPEYVTGGTNLYPKNVEKAKLINNGTLYLNSSIGGYIDLTSTSGRILTDSSFSPSVTITEALSSKSTLKIPSLDKTENHVETCEAYISKDNESIAKSTLSANKKYDGSKSSNEFYWKESIAPTIGTSLVASSNSFKDTQGNSTEISLILSPDNSYFNLTSDITWEVEFTDGGKGSEDNVTLEPLTSDKLKYKLTLKKEIGLNWLYSSAKYTVRCSIEDVYGVTRIAEKVITITR